MKNFTLIQGDCMEKIKQFPDNYFDICFTSPPYNRKRNDKYLNYNDTIKDYYDYIKIKYLNIFF